VNRAGWQQEGQECENRADEPAHASVARCFNSIFSLSP
jgi:hypothetical protein